MSNRAQQQREAERLMNELSRVLAELAQPDEPKKTQAEYFLDTLAANIDNTKLSDADFREFVRTSIPKPAPKKSPRP